MTRPINQELYVLHRPQRIVEAEEDAIREILSGYDVLYSRHRDIAPVSTIRQPREEVGFRGWRSISTPSFSNVPNAETSPKVDAVEINSKSDICDNDNVYVGTSTLVTEGHIRADNKASRAA